MDPQQLYALVARLQAETAAAPPPGTALATVPSPTPPAPSPALPADEAPEQALLAYCQPWLARLAGQYETRARALRLWDSELQGDLRQAGCLALLIAARRYRGPADKLPGTLWGAMREGMKEALRGQHLLCITRYALRTYRRQQAAGDAVSARQSADATAPADPPGPHRAQARVERLQRVGARPCSLDAAVDGRPPLAGVLADLNAVDPLAYVLAREEQDEVRARWPTLSERERQVVVGLCGLDDAPPRSLRELGAELGVSHVTVQKTGKRALNRLAGRAA